MKKKVNNVFFFYPVEKKVPWAQTFKYKCEYTLLSILGIFF